MRETAVWIFEMPMRSQDEVWVTKRVIERTTSSAQVLVREAPLADADRREKPRYDVSISVTLVGDHNFYVGLTENLSEGGLFVRTQRTLPLGTSLKIEFSLPTAGEPLSLVGEVRWVRMTNAVREEYNNFGYGDDDAYKPGMGIQFKSVGPEAARAIAQFVRMRAPDFYAE